jgi:hypothetical protein
VSILSRATCAEEIHRGITSSARPNFVWPCSSSSSTSPEADKFDLVKLSVSQPQASAPSIALRGGRDLFLVVDLHPCFHCRGGVSWPAEELTISNIEPYWYSHVSIRSSFRAALSVMGPASRYGTCCHQSLLKTTEESRNRCRHGGSELSCPPTRMPKALVHRRHWAGSKTNWGAAACLQYAPWIRLVPRKQDTGPV